MSTWSEIIASTQTTAGDSSAATLLEIKKNLNIANKRMHTALKHYFNRKSKVADLVANQQYYQFPPDALKVMTPKYLTSDGRRRPLAQVRSEYQWDILNESANTGRELTYYFIRGADQIGVQPVPSEAVVNGLIIPYQPRAPRMSQDDYSTGTVSVTSGSATVTGSGTAWTAQMAGRILRVTDGSSLYEYRIATVSTGTSLTLEKPYMDLTGTGKSYIIGESPTFPDEYHDSLGDFALYRFFEMNNSPERANYHKSSFETAIKEAVANYASSSTSQVIILDDTPDYNYFEDNRFTVGG